MFLKKLIWAVKRHPLLYTTRFKLLSRKTSADKIGNKSYNQLNKKEHLPEEFKKINTVIFPQGRSEHDWETVSQIVYWMMDNIKGGPGLSTYSSDALLRMINGAEGVCSDKVQVFNNFCVINDIEVREWGTTRIPFNKKYGGHSLNEVYCRELKQWILVDVSYGLYFESDSKKLSVLEYMGKIKGREQIDYKYMHEDIHVREQIIDKIYFHPDSAPFLICNYSNRLYDRFLKTLRPVFPVFIIHFLIFLTGRSYYYLFPDNRTI